MSKLKIILFLSVFLTFCKKKQQIPGNIIPPAKMKLVLWDAMKADEIVNYYRLKDTSYGGLSKHEELYKTVYHIHHISKDDFKKSLQYYQSHPDLLKTILDSIQNANDRTINKTFADSAAKRLIHP